MEKWISVKDRLPSKNGRYLVTYGYIVDSNYRYIKTVEFAENLTKLDNYDFPKNEYNRAGFYDYDSDFGYYEVTKVLAWMELPEVYEGE